MVYLQRYPRLQDLNHGPQPVVDLRRARQGLRRRPAGRGRARAERDRRRPALPPDRGGGPPSERQAARATRPDRSRVGRGIRLPLAQLPYRRGRLGRDRARRERDDELLRPSRRRRTPGRGPVVRGDLDVRRPAAASRPACRAGRRTRPPPRVGVDSSRPARWRRCARPAVSTSRSIPGASGCSSASTGSTRTRRTPGSAGSVRVGEAEVELCGNVGRCIVTSRHPETGARTIPTLDILAEYRHGVETTEPLPFGVWGNVTEPGRVRLGDDVVPRARPPCTRSSPSEQSYVDHAYACLEEMRRQIERAGEAGIGEIEALVLEAWAAKRLRHLRGRRARPLLRPARPRRRPPAALRRPALGARGADADRRQLAGAGRPRLLHGDRRRPAGRRAPPPLPERGPPAARPLRRAARRLGRRRRPRRRRHPARGARAQPRRAHARHRRDDPVRPVPPDHARAGGRARHPGRPRHRQDGRRPAPRVVAPLHLPPRARAQRRPRRRAEPGVHGLHLARAADARRGARRAARGRRARRGRRAVAARRAGASRG